MWEDGGYRAKTFNFYVFPRPFEGSDKRFVCQVRRRGLGAQPCQPLAAGASVGLRRSAPRCTALLQ